MAACQPNTQDPVMVEPRVLFGWAVASQHGVLVLAARPVLTGNDGSVRYGALQAFGGPSTTPLLGRRREGGGVSLQPPHLLQD